MSGFERFWFRLGVVSSVATLAIFVYQLAFADYQLERSVFALLSREVVSVVAGILVVMSILLYLCFMLRTMQVLRLLNSMREPRPGDGQLFWFVVTFFTIPVGVWFVYPHLQRTLSAIVSSESMGEEAKPVAASQERVSSKSS